MFRRVLSSANKFAVCLGGTTAAAAVVALTDKELSKKPEWYQQSVLTLEDSLRKLGKCKPIESLEVLNNAHDIFSRVVDYNSAEISWRLGRVLVEKSELSHDNHEKVHLLHEAVEHFHKAFSLEPAHGCAGAHKWYAVALTKLSAVDNKHKALVHANSDITEHLEKSVKINPNDPFAWHYLGLHHFNNKNYKEAIASFNKAEEIRPDFSAANHYHSGIAHENTGNRDVAVKCLKRALQQPIRNVADGKAKVKAKDALLTRLNQKWEDVDPSEDY